MLSCGDVCLLLNVMEVNRAGIRLVVVVWWRENSSHMKLLALRSVGYDSWKHTDGDFFFFFFKLSADAADP